jgi:hypothetical protein
MSKMHLPHCFPARHDTTQHDTYLWLPISIRVWVDNNSTLIVTSAKSRTNSHHIAILITESETVAVGLTINFADKRFALVGPVVANPREAAYSSMGVLIIDLVCSLSNAGGVIVAARGNGVAHPTAV